MNLSISEHVKNKVSKTFERLLKEDRKRVIISTLHYKLDNGLRFQVNNNVSAVLAPLDSDIATKLKTIKKFCISIVGDYDNIIPRHLLGRAAVY